MIGDLNHGPDTEEYKFWIDAGWVDAFANVGKDPTIKSDIPKSGSITSWPLDQSQIELLNQGHCLKEIFG